MASQPSALDSGEGCLPQRDLSPVARSEGGSAEGGAGSNHTESYGWQATFAHLSSEIPSLRQQDATRARYGRPPLYAADFAVHRR
jgi:hypothetical protein